MGAPYSDDDEIQHHQNAVGQHSEDWLARGAGGPAGNSQGQQRNAGNTAENDAGSGDIGAKQCAHCKGRVNQQKNSGAYFY